MPYCTNCGHQFNSDFNFCPECGTPVYQAQNQRKQIFVGEIRKCPNCGAVLDSFVTNCATCGYEIRNIQVSNAVQNLAKKLEQIESQKAPNITIDPIPPHLTERPKRQETESAMKRMLGWDFNEQNRIEEEREAMSAEISARENELEMRIQDARRKEENFEVKKNKEKANLIMNYPIPNTKEDIFEFALMASSNIDFESTAPDIVSKAWVTKLDQVYKKAKIIFQNSSDSDFEQIESLYQQVKERWKRIETIQKTKNTIELIVKNFGVLCGLVAYIVSIRMDQSGDNSVAVELLGGILLIASACTLEKRNATYLEFLIAALSGAMSIFLARFLDNGVQLELFGGIVLVIVAVNFFKKLLKNKV